MKRRRTKGRRVFITLLIIGIVAGILAGISVFLYTGYVDRARVTEATSIMGRIITSQKVEKAHTGKYYSASTVAEFKSRKIPDITDTKFFTYKTAPTPNGGFIVMATTTDADAFGVAGEWMAYIYDPVRGGRLESAA